MYKKIIQTGDLIEVYEYEYEPSPKRFSVRRRAARPRRRYTRTSRSLNRAKLTFRRMVRATLALGCPVLCTLTMRDIVSIEQGYKAYTAFGVRLRRKYGRGIKWIAVPEFQARGAVHFHALIWGLSYETVNAERSTRALAHLWGQGFLDLRPTDGSPKLASYLSKYMSKGMSDSRLVGKKAYTASRGVLRSVHLNTPTQLAVFQELWSLGVDNSVLTQLSERTYMTQWLGRAKYKSYSTSKTL